MGWNGSDRGIGGGSRSSRKTARKPGKAKNGIRLLTVGVSLVIIAVLGWLIWTVFFDGGKERISEKVSRTRNNSIKDVQPSSSVTNGLAASSPVAQTPERPIAKILGKTPTGLEYISHKAQTNNDGVVVSRYQLADGTWTRVVQLQSKDSLVFETALDNQLALIAMTPLNQMLPPMPPIGNLEEAFKEAITHPIIITEADSEKAKELKEAVLDIRLQISDLLREGYTVNQILAEDASLRLKNVEFRRELQQELNEIYRTEGREAAESYMETANEKLQEHGVIPLSMPESGNSKKRRN